MLPSTCQQTNVNLLSFHALLFSTTAPGRTSSTTDVTNDSLIFSFYLNILPMAQSQELEAASRSSETYLAENGGGRPVRSTSVLHQGSRRHRTELPGAHSRERLRHRQAPNDDDDEVVAQRLGHWTYDHQVAVRLSAAAPSDAVVVNLFTHTKCHVPLSPSSITGSGASCEGNRRSGVSLVMRHRHRG